ncbi:MAG: hypothetical protein JSV20_07510 [Candidatus Bathyarchaeota archaeon]|nr:MAG: hypothetical protein JSV20_07510 [Candidatus Bathyarchaeota archaeon]
MDVKKGDRFELTCGHQGRVIWVSNEGTSFGVRGVRRGCRVCGKGTKGSWTPTVYLHTNGEAPITHDV